MHKFRAHLRRNYWGEGVLHASQNLQNTMKESAKNLNLNSGKQTRLNLTK